MKKLFISQPMKGKTKEEIWAERANAIQAVKDSIGVDFEIIDNFFDTFDVSNALECLGESIKLLASADIAYFAPGWEQARGCKIEHTCAVEYGIHTITT